MRASRRCAWCNGRGINDTESECQYCDCGLVIHQPEIIERQIVELDLENDSRTPTTPPNARLCRIHNQGAGADCVC